MTDTTESEQERERAEWRERGKVVAQAQNRYLYLLLLSTLLFLALGDQIAWAIPRADRGEALPLLGIKLKTATLFAVGPLVISLLTLIGLGTFLAVHYANRNASVDNLNPKSHERLDTVSSAIDFVVYFEPGVRWKRLSFIAYPLCVTAPFPVAVAIAFVCVCEWSVLTTVQKVCTALGLVGVVACVPRLCQVWARKINMFRDAASRARMQDKAEDCYLKRSDAEGTRGKHRCRRSN